MNVLRSIAMAFAMFSRIPMPKVEWKKENMRYMLCALPLVGAAIGGCLALWVWLVKLLGLGRMLYAAGVTLIPLALSGAIHMDGFCDTADALGSHQDAQRKREILKDPHCGAFAVISFGTYMLGYFALASELEISYCAALTLGLMHIISRAAGALLSSALPGAHEGLLSAFTSAAHRAAAWILLAAFLLCAGLLTAAQGITGAAMAAAAVLTLLLCGCMAKKQFGGMSGDIAGFTIQLEEIIMLSAFILTAKAASL